MSRRFLAALSVGVLAGVAVVPVGMRSAGATLRLHSAADEGGAGHVGPYVISDSGRGVDGATCTYSGGTLATIGARPPLVEGRKYWSKPHQGRIAKSQNIRWIESLQDYGSHGWRTVGLGERTALVGFRKFKRLPAMPAFTVGSTRSKAFRIQEQIKWFRPTDNRIEGTASHVVKHYYYYSINRRPRYCPGSLRALPPRTGYYLASGPITVKTKSRLSVRVSFILRTDQPAGTATLAITASRGRATRHFNYSLTSKAMPNSQYFDTEEQLPESQEVSGQIFHSQRFVPKRCSSQTAMVTNVFFNAGLLLDVSKVGFPDWGPIHKEGAHFRHSRLGIEYGDEGASECP